MEDGQQDLSDRISLGASGTLTRFLQVREGPFWIENL